MRWAHVRGAQPNSGLDCLIFQVSRPHSVKHTYIHTRTSDRPGAEISTWQHTTPTSDQETDNHTAGKIRTRHSSNRATADPDLRPLGHQSRLFGITGVVKVTMGLVFSVIQIKWMEGCGVIHVTHNRAKWWLLVNTIMDLMVPRNVVIPCVPSQKQFCSTVSVRYLVFITWWHTCVNTGLLVSPDERL